MSINKAKRSEERSWVWTWLLLLALLLLLIKFFFLGTYYVESPRALLFVAIQAEPQVEGDMLLIELAEGEVVPAEYQEQREQSLLVQVGGEPIQVASTQLRGRVIGRLRL